MKEVGNNEFLRKFMGDLFFHLRKKKRRIFVKNKTVESAPNQETNEPSVKFHLAMDRRQSESELHFNYKHICAKVFKLKQNIKTEVVCKHLVSEAIHKQRFPKMFPQFHKDLFQKNLSAPIAPVSLSNYFSFEQAYRNSQAN